MLRKLLSGYYALLIFYLLKKKVQRGAWYLVHFIHLVLATGGQDSDSVKGVCGCVKQVHIQCACLCVCTRQIQLHTWYVH